MTNNGNQKSMISFKATRRSLLIAVVAGLFATPCFPSEKPRIDEFPKDSVTMTYVLKDNRHVEIKYEKLVRTFIPYAWLSGLSQPRTRVYCYIVITATVKNASGRDIVYRWIDAIPDYSVYFTKVGRLVLTHDAVLIEYTYIPVFPADDHWHFEHINRYYSAISKNPFGGNPRLMVNYARYLGTRSLKEDKDDPSSPITVDSVGTYKWPERYLWDVVSKEDFDKAAEAGDAISFDGIESNGTFEYYYMESRPEEDICYYGRRIKTIAPPAAGGKIKYEIDYYEYYRRRIVRDGELDHFLSAVKTGDAAQVEELLNGKPALIDAYDPDGLTALHLALLSRDRYRLLPVLYRFNPQINAIDYRGRTPLHLASMNDAEKTVTDDLIKRGGKVLWHDCETIKATLRDSSIKSPREKRQKPPKNGWGGNDVYQVWMRGFNSRQAALFAGREQIIWQLGLQGTMDSELGKRMALILDNAHVACSGSHEDLIRIFAPNLRKLVDDYAKLTK